MRKDIAMDWVAALRSGDYAQGKKVLRTPKNKFCCLGVLCNLHAVAHPKIAAQQRYRGEYLGRTGVLPAEVTDWAGMSFNDGTPRDCRSRVCGHGTLAIANDSGVSFAQIAGYIESNYELL